MATKKAQGSTNNGRDSIAKRLGVKVYGWLPVVSWNIIIRQKWNKFWPGEWVAQGRDFTLYATKNWVVKFSEKRRKRFDWRVYRDMYVSVD